MDHPADRTDEKEKQPLVSAAQRAAYHEATGKDLAADGAAPGLTHTRVLAISTLTIQVEAGKILGIGHPVRADAYELSVEREDGEVEAIVVPRWASESQFFYPGSYYVVPLKDDEPTDPPMILPASLFLASGGGAAQPPGDTVMGSSGRSGPHPQGSKAAPATSTVKR